MHTLFSASSTILGSSWASASMPRLTRGRQSPSPHVHIPTETTLRPTKALLRRNNDGTWTVEKPQEHHWTTGQKQATSSQGNFTLGFAMQPGDFG